MRTSSASRLDPGDLEIVFNKGKFELYGLDLADGIKEETQETLDAFVDDLNDQAKRYRFKIIWHVILLMVLFVVSFILIIAFGLPFYFLGVSILILIVFCLEVTRIAMKSSKFKQKVSTVVEHFKQLLKHDYTVEDNFSLRGRKLRYRNRQQGIYLRKADFRILNVSIRHEISGLKSEYQHSVQGLVIPIYSISPSKPLQSYNTPRKVIEASA